MIDKNYFKLSLYDKLPPVYSRHDSDKVLKRYMDSMGDGYASVVEDINNFKDIVDPYLCPSELIPTLCDCFSLPYYRDIPDVYYRKMLRNISSLRARKGTSNCVHYLCRALTGLDIDLDPVNTDPTVLEVYLKADTLEDVLDIDMSTKVIGTFIKEFIPFYIETVTIESVVNEVTMNSLMYRTSLMTYEEETYLPKNYAV